jgi:hypothetical protein
MRFLILVKASAGSEHGVMPSEQKINDMAAFHEALHQAGKLLDASGLQPSAKGWRVDYQGSKTTITDGPFTETKELIAGYTLIQADSREEALAWTKRFPNPATDGGIGQIEVRQLFEKEDFGKSEAIARFEKMGMID